MAIPSRRPCDYVDLSGCEEDINLQYLNIKVEVTHTTAGRASYLTKPLRQILRIAA